MSFTLTRLLYLWDEVEASLLNCLLMKTDIDACYFWCAELYYSDPEDTRNIFNLVWKIYYDFYAAYNPSMERYIQNKWLNWKKNKNIKTLIYIIHNLFMCTPSADVFLLRQYTSIKNGDNSLVIYKTHKSKYDWLNDFPASYHTMLIAIHKKQLSNAALQLRYLVDTQNPKTVYNVIIRYYSRHIELQSQRIIDKKWERANWPDLFHGMLALIVHLGTPIERITQRFVIQQPSNEIVAMIENHNKTIEDRHKSCNKVYRILRDMRIYAIHDLIGVFALDRFKVCNFKEKNRLYWGEYAINCPLWKHRITNFNTLVKKKVIDLNKATDKDFMDHYDMELDEQPENVQMMSMRDIEKITIDSWHDRVFTLRPIVKLECDCVY